MTDLIQRECKLPASPDDVWRALTDPERLGTWLADNVSLELWPGGEASFVVDDRTLRGWVEEVTPPASARGEGRLVFWWADGDEPASRVELTVVGLADGALLRVRETLPLEAVDLVGIPLDGRGDAGWGPAMAAPALVAA
ncbi:MAG: SRPBCC family protein [Solirubrobacteraceae bacterium]